MTTYFGYNTIGGTGSSGSGYCLRNKNVSWTCPGSGPQKVVELTSYCGWSSGGGNNLLAVYNTNLDTKFCEGIGEVAVDATPAWQGHIGAANITPNPCNLTGGVDYVLAVSYDGITVDQYWDPATEGDCVYSADDYTGGYPSSLGPGTEISRIYSIRCGVETAGALKTFVFLSDNEGLADAANSSIITVSWVSDDGNPDYGCLDFDFSGAMTSEIEYARNPSTGITWEDWGVPEGSTVTDVQITAYQHSYIENNKVTSLLFKARIIDSVGDSVTDDTQADLISESLGVDGFSWTAASAGSKIAVNSDRQSSTTDIRLELEVEMTATGGNNSNYRIDTFEITIFYTGSVSQISATINGAASIPQASLKGSGLLSGTINSASSISQALLLGAGVLIASFTATASVSQAALLGSGTLSSTISPAASISKATLLGSGELTSTINPACSISEATLLGSGILTGMINAACSITEADLKQLASEISATLSSAASIPQAELLGVGQLDSTINPLAIISQANLLGSGELASTINPVSSISQAQLLGSGALSSTLNPLASISQAILLGDAELSSTVNAACSITEANLKDLTEGAISATISPLASVSQATLLGDGALLSSFSAACNISQASLLGEGLLESEIVASALISQAILYGEGSLISTISSSCNITQATLLGSGQLLLIISPSCTLSQALLLGEGELFSSISASGDILQAQLLGIGALDSTINAICSITEANLMGAAAGDISAFITANLSITQAALLGRGLLSSVINPTTSISEANLLGAGILTSTISASAMFSQAFLQAVTLLIRATFEGRGLDISAIGRGPETIIEEI